MENTTEKLLVETLRNLRLKKGHLDQAVKYVEEDLEKTKASLIESLEARQASSTAKYEGIGCVSLGKPKLYASYKKEFEEQVFAFLRAADRADLIKETVHHKSLSGFVGEALEAGKNPPEIITYFLKPNLRFLKA